MSEMLLLANVWDVPSAILAEHLGFKAIGTSSGAMARMLGYEDGEKMSFKELFYLVKRISHKVRIPLYVDLEGGYSREPGMIVSHIARLRQLGVVGINIEDSLVEEERSLIDHHRFANLIKSIKQTLTRKGIRLLLNIRTDAFLLEMDKALEKTLERAALYNEAGADGIFVPCMVKESDISTFVSQIDLPLNVMCMPGLSDFNRLQDLGVKRISMGNFVHNAMLECLNMKTKRILAEQSFESIFAS